MISSHAARPIGPGLGPRPNARPNPGSASRRICAATDAGRPARSDLVATEQRLLEGWADTQQRYNSLGDGVATHVAWKPVEALLAEPTGRVRSFDPPAHPRLSIEHYGRIEGSPFAPGRIYLHFLDPRSKMPPALLGCAVGSVPATASASIRSVAVHPERTRWPTSTFTGVLKFSAPWMDASRVIDREELAHVERINRYLERQGSAIQKYLMPDTSGIHVLADGESFAVLARPLPPGVVESDADACAFLSGVVLADRRFWASEDARALRDAIPGAELPEKIGWLAQQIAPQLAELLCFGLARGFVPGVAHLQNVNVLFARHPDRPLGAQIAYQDFYSFMNDELLAHALQVEPEKRPDLRRSGQVVAESLAGQKMRPAQGVRRAVEVGFDRWLNALARLGGPPIREIFLEAFAQALQRFAAEQGLPDTLIPTLRAQLLPQSWRRPGAALGELASSVRDAVVAAKLRARIDGDAVERLFEPQARDDSQMPPTWPQHAGERFDILVEILTQRAHHGRVVCSSEAYLTSAPMNSVLDSDSPELRSLLSRYAIHREDDRIYFLGDHPQDLFMLTLLPAEVDRLERTRA